MREAKMSSNVAESKIINRGRGPEIAGTRITVFDVMDYYKDGWHRDKIAMLFRLSSRDIQAAIDYIEAHREEVEADYQKILDRHRNYKYPPDVQAKLRQIRGEATRRLQDIRQRQPEENRDADDDRAVARLTEASTRWSCSSNRTWAWWRIIQLERTLKMG
jgi:uncharacterized protein (DUF433 family)